MISGVTALLAVSNHDSFIYIYIYVCICICIYIYIYVGIDPKVPVRSFNCESRACHVGNPRESFFSSSRSNFFFAKVSRKLDTSSTAQGGGGSFKNRKPIGEVGCCESGMAERSH